jgi:hypothetical protein
VNATEAALVRAQIEAAEHRAEAAEAARRRAEAERDALRALLARVRTSLNEAHNDPASDGRPVGSEP